MKIVTGYRGEPHITSEQDRAKNQGIFGEGSYVLDVGTKLRADLESGNEIRIHDGVISHQGCIAVIEKGAYDSLILSNGTQGRQRIDLIVARYEKDVETEVESLDLYVIEGTPATSDPQVPAYQNGDIQAGDILVEMPLYTVLLDGVQVSTITSVHKDLSNDDNLLESTRFLANTKVNRAGDTMTGGLSCTTSSGNAFFWATSPKCGVRLHANGDNTNHGVWSVTQNKWLLYANETDVFLNGFDFTNAQKARNSIGAVNKAGDTMTGTLTLNYSQLNIKWEDPNVTPSGAVGSPVIAFYGSDAVNPNWARAYLRAWHNQNAQIGLKITAQNPKAAASNDLYMLVDDSGNKAVSFSDPAAWRTGLGLVTAYDNVNSNMFKYKSYSYQTQVTAGTTKITVTGTNLKVSTPSGYVPLAFRAVSVNNNGETALCLMDASATGSSAVLKINNPNGLGYSLSVSVTIIYVKSGLISAG